MLLRCYVVGIWEIGWAWIILGLGEGNENNFGRNFEMELNIVDLISNFENSRGLRNGNETTKKVQRKTPNF